MSDKKINLIPTQTDDELFCHYDCQYGRQRVFLTLDLEDRELRAAYDANIGGGVTHQAFHNLTLLFEIPPLRIQPLKEIMEEIVEDCNIVLNNTTIEMTNGNWQGHLNDTADDARYRIWHTIEDHSECWDHTSTWEVWDAANYLEMSDLTQDHGITALSSEADITTTANDLAEESKIEGYNVEAEDLEECFRNHKSYLLDILETAQEDIEDKFEITLTDESKKIIEFLWAEYASCGYCEVQLLATIGINNLNYAEIEYTNAEIDPDSAE